MLLVKPPFFSGIARQLRACACGPTPWTPTVRPCCVATRDDGILPNIWEEMECKLLDQVGLRKDFEMVGEGQDFAKCGFKVSDGFFISKITVVKCMNPRQSIRNGHMPTLKNPGIHHIVYLKLVRFRMRRF